MNREHIQRLLGEAAKLTHLAAAVIEYRMRETSMETDERMRAKRAFEEDRVRLEE